MTARVDADPASLVAWEAMLLDRFAFDEWLALYTPDCLFWMPAWRDDGTQTDDPERELSLIYYRGRRNLEDRVARIRSGFSVASAVLPRVAHIVGQPLVTHEDGDTVRVDSAFNVHVHDVRSDRDHAYFGRYEHRLVRTGEGWRIAGKVIRLMNDRVPTLLDVYGI